jgi:excinuclease ABC subunit C
MGAISSALSEIEGIGDKTAEKLLKHFKSVKKVKTAGMEEIEKVIGKAKAKTVVDALK